MSLIYKIYKTLLDNKSFLNAVTPHFFEQKIKQTKMFPSDWLNILGISEFDFCEKMC